MRIKRQFFHFLFADDTIIFCDAERPVMIFANLAALFYGSVRIED